MPHNNNIIFEESESSSLAPEVLSTVCVAPLPFFCFFVPVPWFATKQNIANLWPPRCCRGELPSPSWPFGTMTTTMMTMTLIGMKTKDLSGWKLGLGRLKDLTLVIAGGLTFHGISCQAGCAVGKRYILAIPLRCLSFSVCIQTCKTQGHSYTSISPFCICTLYCTVRRKHHNSNQ